MTKVLLSFAGFDPTSGAGISLDIRVFQSLGFAGMGILTALTVQNTQGIGAVYVPPSKLILEQYRTLREDIRIHGIKIGMIGRKKNIAPVAKILKWSIRVPRVVDPVLRSTSGTWLLEPEAVQDFFKAIRGHVTVITPNTYEAGLLTGDRIHTLREMEQAAKKVSEMCESACVITGGHFEKDAADVLYDGNSISVHKRKKTAVQVHGTGCFFSSALLAFLAKGEDLKEACRLAGETTGSHIKQSERIGKGQGLFKVWD